MPRGFKDTGAYPQWPKLAAAVIEAATPTRTATGGLMTKTQREAFVASLKGWRQTLAQQAAAYIDDELAHDRPIWHWRTHEHYAAVVYGPYASLPQTSCLCHKDYLIEVLAQMWPTHEEAMTYTVREELHIAQRYYQVSYEIAPTGVSASAQGLDDCMATAPTQAEARQRLMGAIALHHDGHEENLNDGPQ
jgi:predicted RNase H-like HicB family nuclease